jgi:hypothetical protein
MHKPHPCRTCRDYECYDSHDYGTQGHFGYPFCTLRNEKAVERCGFYEQDKFSSSWEEDLDEWERYEKKIEQERILRLKKND